MIDKDHIHQNLNRVRVEHQEHPNQAFADAAVRKLFPDGHLVVPGEGSE